MIGVKKSLTAGMDGDSELQALAEDATLNIMNARCYVTEYGRQYQTQNVPGSTLVTNTVYPPYGQSFTIGSCVDENRNYLIWANQNSFNDSGLYAYDYQNNVTYVILYDSQVVGGLGLTKTGRIDRNMYVVGDLLFWTNNEGEPRCVNYIAGIKFNQPSFVTTVEPYQVPIKYQSSTLIVRPPIYVMTVAKQTDAGFMNNFIANNAYQFCYQYVFKNYQTSVLSAYSALVPYNFKTDTFNSVLVKIPFAEVIDNEVQQINACVRYGNTGKTFIVKTWNKSNQQQADQIFSHNLGNVQLQFTFYDNITGIAVDDVTANLPFSNVPLISKTLTPAKDRLFLGYNVMGYNTPMAGSLAATVGTSSVDTRIFKSGSSYKITVEFLDRFRRKCGVVNLPVSINTDPRIFSTTTFTNLINWTLSNSNAVNEIPDWAYYYQILITKNLTRQSFIEGMTQNMYYAIKNDNGEYEFKDTVFNTNTTAAIAVSLNVLNSYGIGYTFTEGDFATIYRFTGTNYTLKVLGQQGNYVLLAPTDIGTVTNNYGFTLLPFSYVNTADTAYLPATSNNPVITNELIVQSVPAAGLNDDPPDLGKVNYIMDNLTFTARSFTASGELHFTVTGTSVTFPNIIFSVYYTHPDTASVTTTTLATQAAVPGTYNLTFSVAANIPAGYNRVSLIIFAPDVVTIDFTSGKINFTEAGANNLFEIYTPFKDTLDENFYEYGDVLNVTNPTTISRQYSTLSGSIIGDTYKVARSTGGTSYFTEAMSPNDFEWQNWQRDIGWVNTVDYIGQQTKRTSIAYSDTFINGTKTNGLCSFQPLNQKDIGSDGGDIQKLILTNKKQEDGTVMLILTDNECLSVYLGETQVVAASTNTFVATNSGVIGTINELRGNSGTVNPESVILYLGLVFWVDANNGWVSQYSPGGVEPISRYKQSRFFKRYLNAWLLASKNNLDNINGFHHIAMGIDPFHEEVFVTLPALIYKNYATILPSYNSVPPYATSIINRFDIYDQLGKTMCFQFNENKWGSNFEYMPEWTDYMQDKTFAFKNGALYILNNNTTTWNTFFGTQYPVRVCVCGNNPVSAMKNTGHIRLEASAPPDYSVVYSQTPNVQLSDLAADDYISDEGVWDSTVLRDRLSPNQSGTFDEKLYTGDQMISQNPQIMLEFQQYTELFTLNFINLYYELSRGQNDLIKK